MNTQNHHTSIVRFLSRFLCLLFWSLTALAEWHGQLSLASDYIYRGYTKNRSNPVVQADFSYAGKSDWFLGSRFSQVSFYHRANSGYAQLEITPYFGLKQTISEDWRTDFLVTAYIYDGKVYGKDIDYSEFSAAMHYKNSLSARIFLAPNAYQSHAVVLNYEINYRTDLLDTVQFSSGLGFNQAGALFGQDYFYWNSGFSWFATSFMSIDLRYLDTNVEPYKRTDYRSYQFYPTPQENKYLFSVTIGF